MQFTPVSRLSSPDCYLHLPMLETLQKLDIDWFIAINHARNGFFDVIMPWFSYRWIWIPMYVILALLLFRQYKAHVVVIIVAIGFMTLVSDQTANLFKNNVMRPRPCHNVELLKQTEVFIPEGCGGPYGFYSAHAANSAGLALILILLMRRKNQDGWRPWLWIAAWSLLVSYSRVYLGVHYPMDVLFGTCMGLVISGLTYFLLTKYYLDKRNV